GLVESKPARASRLQRFGDKARALLQRARTSLHK
ncbi:metal ABC transporter ATPase, partial [Pseudomonas sp. MB-090624]